MQIQSINNTNFKGLFTNKSTSNHWKMEYAPYSWEKNNLNEFGIAEQTEWDVMANGLPDNEKRFSSTKHTVSDGSYFPTYKTVGREECEDILGTEFYYNDFSNNKMRRQIDEVPAMNLENSLKVLNRKLEQFLDKKNIEMRALEEKIEAHDKNIGKASRSFDCSSAEYDDTFFGRNDYKKEMVAKKKEMKEAADSMFSDIKTYIQLRNSAENVKNKMALNAQEIHLLNIARTTDQLIDISRRFMVYDPNKPLWDALHNIEAVKDKIIALPDRILSVKELLRAIGKKAGDKGIPDAGIKYVDGIMHAIR